MRLLDGVQLLLLATESDADCEYNSDSGRNTCRVEAPVLLPRRMENLKQQVKAALWAPQIGEKEVRT